MRFNIKLPRRQEIYTFVKWFIWINLLLAFYGAIRAGEIFILFVVVLTFLFTLTPYFFKERFKLKFPQELELVIILFVYATLFLGEIENYYYVYWWWDIFMHGLSAISLGFIGVGILYEMDKKTIIKARPSTLVFFGFCFAVAMGTLWEIFEFSIDMNFGTNMLKSGLMDTFGDLMVDSFGAFVAAFIGYFYIKKENANKKK